MGNSNYDDDIDWVEIRENVFAWAGIIGLWLFFIVTIVCLVGLTIAAPIAGILSWVAAIGGVLYFIHYKATRQEAEKAAAEERRAAAAAERRSRGGW